MRNKEASPSLVCRDERKHAANYRAYDVVVPQGTFEQLGLIKPLPDTDIDISIYPHGNQAELDVHFDNGPKAVRPWLQDPAEMAYLVNQDPWTHPHIATIDQRAVYRRGESGREGVQNWVNKAVKRALQLVKKGELTTFDGLLLDEIEKYQRTLESGGGASEFGDQAVEEFAIRELALCRQRDMVNALVAAVRKEILKWFAGAKGTRIDRLLPDLDTVIDSKKVAAMQFGIEATSRAETFYGSLKGQNAGNRIRYLWMNRVIGMAQLEIQRLLGEQLAIEGEATYSSVSLSNRRPRQVVSSPPDKILPSNVAVRAHLRLDKGNPEIELRVSGHGDFVPNRGKVYLGQWSYNIKNIGLKNKAPRSANARPPRRSPMAQSG